MSYNERREANLLPLSIEQRRLDLALSEWLYSGETYDLGEPYEPCELCEYPDLRYQFKIVNRHNGNELLVGSECIKHFSIAAIDELGNVLDRDASRRKVNRDRRFLITERRNKSQINCLLRLGAVEQGLNIDSFIDYVQNRGAFTPDQLSLLFQKFRKRGIEYDPRDFKIIIMRGREKTQLVEMPEWKRQLLLPALSPTQKKWLAAKSGNSGLVPAPGGHRQSSQYSPVSPPGIPDYPSATHDRVGNPPPQPAPAPTEPHRSPTDGLPPTGLAEPAQAEHFVDVAAADAMPRNSWADRWFPMLRKRGSNLDRRGKLPGGLINEVMNVHSHKLYAASTTPELGQDYWTTAVLPVIQRKALLGLLKSNVPDFNHQIIAIIRTSMEEAYQVHAQVRHIVSAVAEGEWFTSFPPPAPPDGYSPGVHRKPNDT